MRASRGVHGSPPAAVPSLHTRPECGRTRSASAPPQPCRQGQEGACAAAGGAQRSTPLSPCPGSTAPNARAWGWGSQPQRAIRDLHPGVGHQRCQLFLMQPQSPVACGSRRPHSLGPTDPIARPCPAPLRRDSTGGRSVFFLLSSPSLLPCPQGRRTKGSGVPGRATRPLRALGPRGRGEMRGGQETPPHQEGLLWGLCSPPKSFNIKEPTLVGFVKPAPWAEILHLSKRDPSRKRFCLLAFQLGQCDKTQMKF